jgi:hypothetical protein
MIAICASAVFSSSSIIRSRPPHTHRYSMDDERHSVPGTHPASLFAADTDDCPDNFARLFHRTDRSVGQGRRD